MALLDFTSPKSQVWSQCTFTEDSISGQKGEKRPLLTQPCESIGLFWFEIVQTYSYHRLEFLQNRKCCWEDSTLNPTFSLDTGHPAEVSKPPCYSQAPLQSEARAHSVFLNSQLEEVTTGLSTWLRTRDLTHIHKGMGFISFLTTKEFELILPKSL